MSAPAPDSTMSPWFELVRRHDVALGAVHVVQQRDARRAVGVVLDVSDLGVTPSLSLRRKSMTRYWRLWPPPMWRVVMRPGCCGHRSWSSGRSSDFSGVDRVISAKSATDEPRRPGRRARRRPRTPRRGPHRQERRAPACRDRARAAPCPRGGRRPPAGRAPEGSWHRARAPPPAPRPRAARTRGRRGARRRSSRARRGSRAAPPRARARRRTRAESSAALAQLARGREHADGDGEIEAPAFLRQVRRRETHGDAPLREIEAARRNAARTRSRDSFTSVSGRPTMLEVG